MAGGLTADLVGAVGLAVALGAAAFSADLVGGGLEVSGCGVATDFGFYTLRSVYMRGTGITKLTFFFLSLVVAVTGEAAAFRFLDSPEAI